MSDFRMYLEALRRAEQNGVLPNFWCSEDYFVYSGMVMEARHGILSIRDSDGDLLLPPMDFNRAVPFLTGEPFWADLKGMGKHVMPLMQSYHMEFLDYEFLYDPSKFAKMEGSDFAVFRKNSKKWPRRNPGSTYRQESPKLSEVGGLIESWSIGEEVEDAEAVMNYVLYSKNIWSLRDIDGRLMGVNIYDWNHRYVNFRYCICPSEPFLSEYLRWLFYTETKPTRMVNDGGILGRTSLGEFKKKLQPIEIRSVFSWKTR